MASLATAQRPDTSSILRWLDRLEAIVYRRRPLLHGIVGLAAFALSRPTDLTNAIAAVVVFLGMLVRLWATGHIHKNVELATDGPYATVRHPLYLGNLVIFVGMALAANTVIATVMISVSVGLLYGLTIHYEERHLRRRFGGAYDQYTACVPVIIPRFHKGRLRLRKGSVPTQSSFLLSICGALLLVAIFELQEDLLEYLLGIEYNPVWGLDIPHIISHL